MSALAILALSFFAVIVVGTLLTLVHDALEQHLSQAQSARERPSTLRHPPGRRRRPRLLT